MREVRCVDAQLTAPRIPDHEVLFQADRLGAADVTVVIPLYNYAEYIVEALESVRAQTLAVLDLIVMDDQSIDDSLQVALNWLRNHAGRFNRVLLLRNNANSGLALTRNVGFDWADTPWVLPLDADNRLLPDCAAECLRVARQSGAAFVYPVIKQFGAASNLMGNAYYDPVRLANGNYIDAMALISRAAWLCVGGYIHGHGGWEDFDLWCRLAERGFWGELVAGRPLAEYRVHPTSMIRSTFSQPEIVRGMINELNTAHHWLRLFETPPSAEKSPAKFHREIKSDATGGMNGSGRATPTAAGPARILQFPPSRGSERDGVGLAADFDKARLRGVLPLLRCPDTGQRLVLAPSEDVLVSEDGTRRWPLVMGRPVLFPGLGAPAINSDTHLSNPLPASALAMIHSTSGQILHLSAGGSTERFDHVIEAEAAVFRHTDLVCDVHRLPFEDQVFEAVIALNAFEHYRDPPAAAGEIRRVLRPGGRVLIQTAFLQPLHEPPWHFYNCTRFGLEAWFKDLEIEKLHVSDNFHPGYSLAWLASECESALRSRGSEGEADNFLAVPLQRIVSLWRAPESARPEEPVWSSLAALPQEVQEGLAAGFELVARRPLT
jgi:SAM-dependent methyltransferase